MTRPISADYLKETFSSFVDGNYPKFKLSEIKAIIDSMPTFERPQGEWYHSCANGWECSNCHEQVKEMPTVMRKAVYTFCPFCGADMRGDKKGTTFDDYLKEQLKDPEFRKEWEKLDKEDMQKGDTE